MILFTFLNATYSHSVVYSLSHANEKLARNSMGALPYNLHCLLGSIHVTTLPSHDIIHLKTKTNTFPWHLTSVYRTRAHLRSVK